MDTSKGWVEKGARFGHLTKGILYGLMGALALQVALGSGGQVAGGREAAHVVEQQPFGKVLLVLLAVGLAGYAVWRLISGVKDAEHHGRDGKGLAKRAAALASGLANGALAVAVFQMALGQSEGGGDGARSWVGQILSKPFGSVLIGLVGAAIVSAGLAQFHQAYTKKFLENFRWQGMSPRQQRLVTLMGQVGYSARGVVFPIIGVGLVKAALDHDASETRGVREALLDIAHSGAGQLLLGVVAVGFLAFGSFLVASARHRQIAC